MHTYMHTQSAETDPRAKAVLLEGEGEKAFCAGGDIRGMYVCITKSIQQLFVRLYEGSLLHISSILGIRKNKVGCLPSLSPTPALTLVP